VSFRYLICVREIFDRCAGDIFGVLDIFDGCPGDILTVSLRYLFGFLEILMGILEIFGRCPGDI